MEYNVDHFIKKFERIPKELWLRGNLKPTRANLREGVNPNASCALGHCGLVNYGGDVNDECGALIELCGGKVKSMTAAGYERNPEYDAVYEINDDGIPNSSSPKDNMLTYLKSKSN